MAVLMTSRDRSTKVRSGYHPSSEVVTVVGEVIRAFVPGEDSDKVWKGTVAELLDAVNASAPETLRKSKNWPASAKKMAPIVRELDGKGFFVNRRHPDGDIEIKSRRFSSSAEDVERTAGYTRRAPAVYAFPKPIVPDGNGTMPLTAAALWIVSQGGRMEITDRHEKEWIAAIEDELIKAVVGDGVELKGRDRVSRIDGVVLASNLKGAACRYTFLRPSNSDLASTDDEIEREKREKEIERKRLFWDGQYKLEPGGKRDFVQFGFSPVDDVWNAGENDKLFLAGQCEPVRTHLQLSMAYVRERWPLHLAQKQPEKRGAKERWDWEALAQKQKDHLTTNGAFRTPTDHQKWCIQNLSLKPKARPAKGKFRGDPPDPHTVADGIKRHKLNEMPGVFAED
jgi:hypothetical protein